MFAYVFSIGQASSTEEAGVGLICVPSCLGAWTRIHSAQVSDSLCLLAARGALECRAFLARNNICLATIAGLQTSLSGLASAMSGTACGSASVLM